MKKIKAILASDAPRYVCSSLIAFAINYVAVLVLEKLLKSLTFGLEISMVLSWLLSSHVNFLINRSFVFRSKDRILPAYLKYYTLALPVFVVKNVGFLELLYRLLHLKVSIAYPIAEAMMFVVTYLVQKKLIFRKKKTERQEKSAFEKADGRNQEK
ncbi:MAG: GtrA family protein [Eubacteriales bacterium]